MTSHSYGFYAAARRVRDGGDAGFVPTLNVTTRDAGDAVDVVLRDNGTDIPADIKDKLFQPFFTTKPTGEGTGVGLSITYDIVTKAHSGDIAVDRRSANTASSRYGYLATRKRLRTSDGNPPSPAVREYVARRLSSTQAAILR
jgi:light-regulated signal transduction histidine kinase (bacteriophytochrome)